MAAMWRSSLVAIHSWIYYHFTINAIKQGGQYSEQKPKPLNLLVQSWIYEQRTLHVMMMSCLLGFIFSGNANCVTGLYHAWRYGDRFYTFNCRKKDKNNALNYSESTSFGAVKTLLAPSTIHLKTFVFFEWRSSVVSEMHFTFFSWKVLCKTLGMYDTFYNVKVRLCNMARDWDGFFSSLFSLEETFLRRNPFHADATPSDFSLDPVIFRL